MDLTRDSLGMVIPIWFPPALTDGQVRETLLTTLHDCEHYLPWEHVVLVVDGDARSAAIVQELQRTWRQRHGQAFEVVYSDENRGKGFAVFRGAEWFLERRELQFLTVRDADGRARDPTSISRPLLRNASSCGRHAGPMASRSLSDRASNLL